MSALHSALSPSGPFADEFARLWWVIVGLCAFVFIAIQATLLRAIDRGRAGAGVHVATRTVGRSVAAATAVTVVILIALLVTDAQNGRAMAALGRANGLEIEVTGYQWWWQVEYLDPQPSRRFTTANEIRVPTGRPVFVRLKAADVIHSFWIPSLQGKTDLIPGRTNGIWIQATRPGAYYGQCAEFCGLQHAHMALLVVAQPPREFDEWVAQQRQEAVSPGDPMAQHGRQLFEQTACVMCHTIRGTVAGARVGPDLTHVASRYTIAAGALSNGPAEMRTWLRDPQRVKPGTKMPATGLTDDEQRDLAFYLEALK